MLVVALALFLRNILGVEAKFCSQHSDCIFAPRSWCCEEYICCTFEDANPHLDYSAELLLGEIFLIIFNIAVVIVGCTFAFKSRCRSPQKKEEDGKHADVENSGSKCIDRTDDNENLEFPDPAPPYTSLQMEASLQHPPPSYGSVKKANAASYIIPNSLV